MHFVDFLLGPIIFLAFIAVLKIFFVGMEKIVEESSDPKKTGRYMAYFLMGLFLLAIIISIRLRF